MISLEDIEKLSELARINLDKKEKKELQEDLEAILTYVEKLKLAPIGDLNKIARKDDVVNKIREDANPHKPGEYSKDILNEAPAEERGYFRVKRIL